MLITIALFARFPRKLAKNPSALDILDNGVPIVIFMLTAFYGLYNVYLTMSFSNNLSLDFFQFTFAFLLVLSVISKL